MASIDERTLPRLVPDVHKRVIYVCGPDGFVAHVASLAAYLGIPDEAIHHEAFAL